MNKKTLLILKMLSFTIMGAMGTFVNYINLYLEQVLGFTGTQIGLITMLSLGLVIVINPVLGFIGDKTGSHILMLKIAFFMSMVFTFIYANSRTFGVVLVVAILFEAARACIPPFFDLITSDYCVKVNYDFGKVRVFSSIGFMITVMTVGFLIAGLHVPLFGRMVGFDGFVPIEFAVFGAVILFMALSLVLMFFVPKPEKTAGTGQGDKKFNLADIKELLLNKQYQFILVLIILSLVTLESAKTFVGNHLVVGLGSAENIVSIMTFMMVVPEFVLVPMGSKIIRHVGFKKWYIFTMVTMVIRMSVYAFTHSVGLFAVVSLLHGIGVTTHISGNITFIRKVVKPKVLGLSFTIMVSVLAFSRAILSFVYGMLYEHFDGFMVFRVAAVLLFCGLLWVIRSKSLNIMGRSDI